MRCLDLRALQSRAVAPSNLPTIAVRKASSIQRSLALNDSSVGRHSKTPSESGTTVPETTAYSKARTVAPHTLA